MPTAEPEADARARRARPLAILCLSGFGLGLSPVMPGTVASLAVALLLHGAATGIVAGIGLVIACVVFGSWATLAFADEVPARSGDRKQGDPGWVVSDEVAGQALASAATLPWLGDVRLALVAFVAFRVFDMVKVGPVGAAERLPGARGVLLDDVVAGLLAAGVTLVAAAFLP